MHRLALARCCLLAFSCVTLLGSSLIGCDDDDDAGQAQQDAVGDTGSDQSTADTADEDLVADTRDTTDVGDTGDGDDMALPDLTDADDVTTDSQDTAPDPDTADTIEMDTVDPMAPSCTILQPADGTTLPFTESWDFIASAVDTEDGVLSGASVVWTTDRTSTPLGTGTQFSATFDGSGEFVVTCTAFDADGNTGSDSTTVTVESPIADIFHPANGETRQLSDGPFPFVGQAEDAEDGALSGVSLVWTTTVDGTTMEIGTGTMFEAVLPEGTNEVTLTATDGEGNTGADSIIVVMVP